jgi:hypothetical protein
MQTTNIFCNLNKNASMPVMPSMPSMQNKNPSLPSTGPIIERYANCSEQDVKNGNYSLECGEYTAGYYIGKQWDNCYQKQNGSWSQVDGPGAAVCESQRD